MGSQQFLLTALISILVTVATYKAVKYYSNSALYSMENDFTIIMLDVASELDVFWHKPTMLGGGSHSFKNANFASIGCPLGTIGKNNRECKNEDLGETITLYPSPDSVLMVATINYFDELHTAEYVIKANDIHLSKSWTKISSGYSHANAEEKGKDENMAEVIRNNRVDAGNHNRDFALNSYMTYQLKKATLDNERSL